MSFALCGATWPSKVTQLISAASIGFNVAVEQNRVGQSAEVPDSLPAIAVRRLAFQTISLPKLSCPKVPSHMAFIY